jgi:hypothetical protein
MYYAKFRPYNKNTLSILINKTIKFSTVFEFNDFNELSYDAWGHYEESFIGKLKETLKNPTFRVDLLKEENLRWIRNSYPEGEAPQDAYNYFKRMVKTYSSGMEFDKRFLKILEQSIAFLCTGIFCVSDIDVFSNYAAHLMFAHYADNYKGLCLIYKDRNEQDTIYRNPASASLIQVRYNNEFESIGCVSDDILKCFEDTYENDSVGKILNKHSEIVPFMQKYTPWEYEKEFRFLCSKPQIVLAEEYSFFLTAILHTSSYNKEEIKILKKINEEFYDGKVRIQEIYSHPRFGQFEVKQEGIEKFFSVKEWLDK